MIRTALLALLLVAAPLAWSDTGAGTIKSTAGQAHILRGEAQLPATVGAMVQVSDSIVTGDSGTVGITLRDNTRLTAGPNSTLQLSEFVFDTTTHRGSLDASVSRGTLAVISGKLAKASPESVRFRTPTVTLGVRGTRFIIKAEQTADQQTDD